MLSSPSIDWLDHWFLALTRLAQRSLTLQPGNLLIRPALTLSVGFSMSITLHAATQARRLLALTAAGLPSRSESHPMDHDSNSSGHTKIKGATLKFQITAWRERETGEWSVGVMARWSAVRRYSNTPAGQLFYTSPFS